MTMKTELLKGGAIGLCSLPILLFLTISGGKAWAKKWWVWVGIGITLVALVTIVIMMGSSASGVSSMGAMYY